MTPPSYRLPRSVEADPRAGILIDAIRHQGAALRPGGGVPVLRCAADDNLAAALRTANLAGRLVRGTERVEQVLAAEEKGLRLADRASGAARGARVSRLLLVSDDGSERFYRRVENLLTRHAPRLLAVRVRVDDGGLAGPVYGRNARARMLLLTHKEAVSAVLLAVADALARLSG